MPIVFIHGVNTRDNETFRRDCATRETFLRDIVLMNLSTAGCNLSEMHIHNSYWGGHGVSFRWNQASLPSANALEPLGPGSEEPSESESEFALTVLALVGDSEPEDLHLEALGQWDGTLKRAAMADLPRFTGAVLSPITLDETIPGADWGETAEITGVLQALLILAADEAARDPHTEAAIAAARSDAMLMQLLEDDITTRFLQRVQNAGVLHDHTVADAHALAQLESLGTTDIPRIQARIHELFTRPTRHPVRDLRLQTLWAIRDSIHTRFAHFFGDVFVYLEERGSRDEPGPIIRTVHRDLQEAVATKQYPEEPLIVITHSMGGSIFYDLVTHYAPDLHADVWVSVGGQVGQFEEMKLFKASDKVVVLPQKVNEIKPRVRYWWNIYDPADMFAFRASPIFADVDADVEFDTQVMAIKSHGAYFRRPGLYHVLREYLERAFK